VKSAERYVLDSFALLAYFEDEAGAAIVEEILGACDEDDAEAFLSIVNFGEVLYITEREQGLQAAQRAVAAIDDLPLLVIEADRSRTFAAAHVKARHAVAYGDAFAIALAQEVEARVVTGDPEFEKVRHLVRVRWLGATR
jgi:ribonuclease VapC